MNDTNNSIKILKSLYLGPEEIWEEFCRCIQARNIRAQWSEINLNCLVLLGGTGVGKSSWTNKFVKQTVSSVSPVRPCTAKPVFLCSESTEKNLRQSLNDVDLEYWDFEVRTCELPLESNWIIVDCPDYDSLDAEHHALSRFMARLSSAQLLITSPAKYGDELTINAIKFAKDLGKPLKIIVNKWDVVPEAQQSQLHDALSKIFPEYLYVSSHSDNDAESLIGTVKSWLSNLCVTNDTVIESDPCIDALIDSCQESYGRRRYLIKKMTGEMTNDLAQFWERHQLVQLEIEKALRQSLSKIAEEKIFYFSKFFVKYLFSFVEALKPSHIEGSDDVILDRFAIKIRENLELSLEQLQEKLRNNHTDFTWMNDYPVFEVKQRLIYFDEGFSNLKDEIFLQLSEKFRKSAGTKHSVMAVSQEVLLSLLFYSFLGPIGLIPGWEQALSGLCYMIYGKIPSAHLPTVMLELEEMSKECREKFDNFLKDIIEKPIHSLEATSESLQQDFTEFEKSLDLVLKSAGNS